MDFRKKWIWSFIVFLFLMISFQYGPFPSLVENTEAVTGEGVTVALKESKLVANPSYEKNATVHCHGTVFVCLHLCADVQYLFVELNTDTGSFNASKIPMITFNKAQKQQSFAFEIYIPWDTNPSELRSIGIGGTWRKVPTNETGQTSNATAVLTVGTFYHMAIDHKKKIDIGHGKSGQMALNYTNLGNVADNYRIEIPQLLELSNRGIHIEIFMVKMRIPPGSYYHDTIRIEIKQGIPSGDYLVDMHYFSKNAETLGIEQKAIISNFTIHVKGSFIEDIGIGKEKAALILTSSIVINVLTVTFVIFFEFIWRNNRSISNKEIAQ